MNCKPGDLAIVVPPAHSANAGAIVKVLRPATPMDFANYKMSQSAPGWMVQSVGRELKIFDNFGECESCKTRPFADRSLRPISGLPDTEDTDTEQPIKEVA